MGVGTSFDNYKSAFIEFKNYINVINKSQDRTNEIYEGYFVDYNEYQQFENIINNSQINKEQNNYNIKSKKLSTVNINEINNKILNDNKFIIINNELHKIICEQNSQDNINNKINYKIIPNFIEIYTINGNKFQYFNNKMNIIDKSAIVEKISTSKNLIKHIKTTNVDKIYLQIINFYENEKLIKSYLMDKQNIIIYKSFLIDKKWVDNWIKFSHYEIINKEFFQKDIFNAKEIKNYLKNEQINNNIINDLNKINDINK